jgi:WD40-like Beta Propeller Repeat
VPITAIPERAGVAPGARTGDDDVGLARRWRQLVLVVALVAAAVTAAPQLPAHAELPQLTAMFLRHSSGTVFRQPGIGGAALVVRKGTTTDGTVTVPSLGFVSEINSLASTYQNVDISAGLAVGTYATSRMPGQAAALLSTGFSGCSDAGPGTITVTEAEYDGNGLPTRFSASFDIAACGENPAVHGELRWNSTAPLALALAPGVTSLSQPVTVNSVADLVVTLTAKGNSPTTLGSATLHQTPLWDGSVYWSIRSNGCTGKTLAPGASCALILRFAPLRPDGYPEGTIDATVGLGDGQLSPTVAHIIGQVKPLPGQPVNLMVEGAFRHLVLFWSMSSLMSDWSSNNPTTYRVYQYRPDGSLMLIGTTQQEQFIVANLPDGYQSTYAVTASQTSTGALSVRATGTTATSELLTSSYQVGVRNRRLTPAPAAVSTELRAMNFAGSVVFGGGALAVSRNQSVLAWTDTEFNNLPVRYATVQTVSLTGAAGSDFHSYTDWDQRQWDTEPSLSPDGSRVVYTHAAAPGDPTVLRMANTTSGSTPTDLAGSANLRYPTFSADGTSVIATRTTAGVTDLVRLYLSTGAFTAVPGSTGLSQPDVAADGRIVAIKGTDDAQPFASGLVLLPPGAAVTTPLPAAQQGSNNRPRFSADGSGSSTLNATTRSATTAPAT